MRLLRLKRGEEMDIKIFMIGLILAGAILFIFYLSYKLLKEKKKYDKDVPWEES